MVSNLLKTCSMASGLIVMSPSKGQLRAATVKSTRIPMSRYRTLDTKYWLLARHALAASQFRLDLRLLAQSGGVANLQSVVGSYS